MQEGEAEKPQMCSRQVSKYNIRINLKLLNFRFGPDSKTKFVQLLNWCDDELAEEIIDENLSSWEQIENFYIKEIPDQDNLVKLCCQQRNKSEPPSSFSERIFKEFSSFKVSEETSLRWLSYNIWPGRLDLSLKLLQHKNFLDFKSQVDYLVETHAKKKRKIWCTNCQSPGHLTEKCFNNKK